MTADRRPPVIITALIAVLIPWLLLQGVATAQSDPAPALRTQARQFTEKGMEQQARGNFLGAVALYQRAYKLIDHPILLYNIAQAYRLAGNARLALGYYRDYLRAAPQGIQRRWAKQFIAEIEQTHAAQYQLTALYRRVGAALEKLAQVRGETAADPLRRRYARIRYQNALHYPQRHAEISTQLRALDEDITGELKAEIPPVVSSTATGSGFHQPGKVMRLTGLSLITVGVGALSAGLALSWQQRHGGARWTELASPQTVRSDTAALLLTGTAAAAICTGLALYFNADADTASTPALSIAPALAPSSIGLGLSGRF